MYFQDGKAMDVKIAYIGGGSRGWAWGLMSDLALEQGMTGTVFLYDIDQKAAHYNEVIGNGISKTHKEASLWQYQAADSLEEALTGADFMVISILPGTFEEMESDVHTPEKYGIYQSVGDTTGPGGVVRALRTLPMFVTFAQAIRTHCPEAFVINYTNPMSMCLRTLYRTFPQIKAIGCCHEVFGTQRVLCAALKEIKGIEDAKREEIKVNVMGLNHFTWINEAYYKDMDLFPVYEEFAQKVMEQKADTTEIEENWMNQYFRSKDWVKLDLFQRYGVIAAAGDRHLAEFCPGAWYLKDVQCAIDWGFHLTPVSWRKNHLKERLEKSERLYRGEEAFELEATGEEGVKQIKALLGLGDYHTNVNLPNSGQIPNMPLGAIVETNAQFTSGSVKPTMAGNLPDSVAGLTMQALYNQELVVEAALRKDLNLAFQAFINDPLVTIGLADAKDLFDTMIQNTRTYLAEYQID